MYGRRQTLDMILQSRGGVGCGHASNALHDQFGVVFTNIGVLHILCRFDFISTSIGFMVFSLIHWTLSTNNVQ